MRPLRYEDEALLLLDQTRLPDETAWVVCKTAESVGNAIRGMIVRGAPAIGVTAAYGVALSARTAAQAHPDSADREAFLAAIHEDLDRLATTRPTAVNLFWALDRMRGLLDGPSCRHQEPEQVAGALLDEARRIEAEDVAVCHGIGAHGNALIPDGARILTHCNAGALATADYGTALGVVRAAHDAGKRIHVHADETRPYLQGARLTAWELMQDGIPVTLNCDNMAGWLMANGQIDLVITGADRIAANGDTANKIGTYSLAVLARHHGIPFYVAAPLSTIDRSLPDGRRIPIETRPSHELTEYRGLRLAPEGVGVYNPAFDVTPAGLITAIITERGILRGPYERSIADVYAVGRGPIRKESGKDDASCETPGPQ